MKGGNLSWIVGSDGFGMTVLIDWGGCVRRVVIGRDQRCERTFGNKI